MRAIRQAHPAANILIYTEYADSQLAALRALRELGAMARCWRSAVSMSNASGRAIAERCAEEDGIILISTDSLAEGLNLQRRCCNLIHLDLPYNPNRLEQRNGRIDRYGQEHDPQIRYLYLAGTFEERLLLRLDREIRKGSCAPRVHAGHARCDGGRGSLGSGSGRRFRRAPGGTVRR